MRENTLASISDYRQSINRGLIAHLMVVTHFIQKTTMDTLMEGGRYSKLSLAYERYISLLAEEDLSPGELATILGISKQACSKSIKELEASGLVVRRKNPEDSRSSLLSLTAEGRQLLQDGIAITSGIYQQFAAQVGIERMQQLVEIQEKLCSGFNIEWRISPRLESETALANVAGPIGFNLLLPKLNTYFRQVLLASLTDKGFTGLKPSLGQVLGLISREDRRIQYIASVTGISKQAVAALAADLEREGYITRAPDPGDRRQVILSLSPLGGKLLSESVLGIQSLDASIRGMLSKKEYQLLEDTFAAIYLQVAEHYDTANVLPARIQQLSEYLLAELGVSGVRSLTRHLMTITRG
jgi:DNA-binding MarR family transcriptional regulator